MNTDCDYEMTADESYDLEDAIQNRPSIDPYEFQPEPDMEPVTLRAGAMEWVLSRFNR